MWALLVLTMLAVIASTMSILALHAVRPVGLALLQKMAELAIIALPKLMAHLALPIGSNFVELVAQNEAFA